MPEPTPNAGDVAAPTPSPQPVPISAEDEGPLSEDDDALLRELGGWLHTRASYEAAGPGPTIVVAPPLPPLSESQLQAQVDAVLGREHEAKPQQVAAIGGRRRRLWPMLITHAAVAASTVLVIRLWTAEPSPPPSPYDGLVFALAGGDASTLGGASTEPVYLPDSDFVLELRNPRGAWPSEDPFELVIQARRADVAHGAGFDIPVPDTALEIIDSTLRYSASTTEALPGVPPGRWTLTFMLGPPGACLLPEEDPERCITVGSSTIELRAPRGAHAP